MTRNTTDRPPTRVIGILEPCHHCSVVKRADLRASTWRVSHLTRDDGSLEAVTATPAPTLQFKEERAWGTTGVNRWSSPFTLVGTDLCFGQVATTMMAGPEPLMEQEQIFVEILSRVDGYSIAGPMLEVREGDEVIALLEAVPTTIDGNWNLLMLNNGKGGVVSLVEGTVITARFEEGAIAGTSGCNRYRASCELGDGQIKIGPGMGTRKACSEPPGIMEQERRFLSLFEHAARYEITDGTTLDLYDEGGARLLQFVRPVDG